LEEDDADPDWSWLAVAPSSSRREALRH
jgi:hypothetical protein